MSRHRLNGDQKTRENWMKLSIPPFYDTRSRNLIVKFPGNVEILKRAVFSTLHAALSTNGGLHKASVQDT